MNRNIMHNLRYTRYLFIMLLKMNVGSGKFLKRHFRITCIILNVRDTINAISHQRHTNICEMSFAVNDKYELNSISILESATEVVIGFSMQCAISESNVYC